MIRKLLSIFRDSTNTFEGQEAGEQVVLLLRRHPFTIIVRLSFFALLSLIPIVLYFIFFTYLEAHHLYGLFLLIVSIYYLGLWFAAFYALTMYTLNTMIITDHRVIDNDQHGLFHREISVLHSHKIQDVTSHTNGMIETFLKFGDVVIQTAGSDKHFLFKDVAKPDEVKDVIMHIAKSRDSGVMLK